ncbi:type 1 glutamine amidotransferase [Haloarchaeobius sp. HRN-SO-5]|uniref:type 1 glutamine amidotransferase n=1 Tax=Haloarchaeobius sp. HRN-SO-5 TaxID=3446118 RepID=UPI003EB8924A
MHVAYLVPPDRLDYATGIGRSLDRRLPDELAETRFSLADDEWPADPGRFDLVVVTGSETNVSDSAAWFDPLGDVVDEVMATGTPLVGVCFGHQFLATHLGGTVDRLHDRREGVRTIELTDRGRTHPLFDGFDARFESFVYHEDVVIDLPPDAVELARDGAGLQAFGLEGSPVAGIQFHPEFDDEMARRVRIIDPAVDRRVAASRAVYANALRVGQAKPKRE